MQLYTKYIIKNLVGPLLMVTLTITLIIWLMQSLRILKLIASENLNFLSFIYLSLLNIPSLIFIILPISSFLAVLISYHCLNNDSEIIILRNAGLSKMALAYPALVVAVVVTLCNLLLSCYLLPFANMQFRAQKIYMRDNYLSVMLQDGVFNSPMSNLTFYIESKAEDGSLKGIFIHDSRENGVTFLAQSGELVKTDAGLKIDLHLGNRQEIDKHGQLQTLYFEHLSYYFTKEAVNEGVRSKSVGERYLSELFYPQDADPQKTKKYKAEAHQRLSWPFLNINLTLVALVCILSASYNRRTHFKKYIIAAIAAIFIVCTAIAIGSVVSAYPIWTALVYCNIFLVMGSLVCLLKRG